MIEVLNVDRSSAVVGVHDNPFVVTTQRVLSIVDESGANAALNINVPGVAGSRIYIVGYKVTPFDADVTGDTLIMLSQNNGGGALSLDIDYLGDTQKRGVPSGTILPFPLPALDGYDVDLDIGAAGAGCKTTATLFYYIAP